jgi:hypothetical protein
VTGMVTSDVAVIKDGDRYIEINDSSKENILSQILSTFKFIK